MYHGRQIFLHAVTYRMMPPVLLPISHVHPVSILARCPLQCMILKCLYVQTHWQYTACRVQTSGLWTLRMQSTASALHAESACSAGVPGPLQAKLPEHVSLGYSLTCPCYACCDRMPLWSMHHTSDPTKCQAGQFYKYGIVNEQEAKRGRLDQLEVYIIWNGSSVSNEEEQCHCCPAQV